MSRDTPDRAAVLEQRCLCHALAGSDAICERQAFADSAVGASQTLARYSSSPDCAGAATDLQKCLEDKGVPIDETACSVTQRYEALCQHGLIRRLWVSVTQLDCYLEKRRSGCRCNCLQHDQLPRHQLCWTSWETLCCKRANLAWLRSHYLATAFCDTCAIGNSARRQQDLLRQWHVRTSCHPVICCAQGTARRSRNCKPYIHERSSGRTERHSGAADRGANLLCRRKHQRMCLPWILTGSWLTPNQRSAEVPSADTVYLHNTLWHVSMFICPGPSADFIFGCSCCY